VKDDPGGEQSSARARLDHAARGNARDPDARRSRGVLRAGDRPVAVRDLDVSPSAIGWFIATVYLGAMIGSARRAAGWRASDRSG
jgi:hypothetical protein